MSKVLHRIRWFALAVIAIAIFPFLMGANIPQTSSRDVTDDWFIYVKNTSGGVLNHGDVVIWDSAETTNLGVAVTTTSSADSEKVAGVVPDSSASVGRLTANVADDGYLWIQIRGLNDDVILGAGGTAFVDGQSVGTFTTAKTCDDGDGVGVALEVVSGIRASCYINIDN